MPPKVNPQIGAQGSGSTTLGLAGSGSSLMRPRRYLHTFNNLILNNQGVIDKYRCMTFSGMGYPDLKDDRVELSQEDGELPLDAYFKGRTMAIDYRIESHQANKLDDMREAIERCFGVLTEQQFLFTDPQGLGRDFYIMCRPSQPLVWTDEVKDYNHYMNVMVSLRASNYRKVKTTTTTLTTNLGTGTLTNVVAFTPTHAGSATSQPVIRLTGGLGGTITVLNNANGMSFQITGGIANGTYLDIDSANRTVKDNLGASKKSKFLGRFIEYEPGSTNNQILISTSSAGSGTPQIRSIHAATYL